MCFYFDLNSNDPIRSQFCTWPDRPCSQTSCKINTLCPIDTIWRHRSGSTLVQVMASCLTKHQAITWTNHDFSLMKLYGIHLSWEQLNFTMSAQAIILFKEFENHILNEKNTAISPVIWFTWFSKLLFFKVTIKCIVAFLIHWGQDKMATIFLTTFSKAFKFSWMKIN